MRLQRERRDIADKDLRAQRVDRRGEHPRLAGGERLDARPTRVVGVPHTEPDHSRWGEKL